ncbi:MAG: SIMPL domain-containing protein [Anaerotignum sp.]|nr:SIMPL domain-containing protein [Anaerotignum sp.]
MKKWKKIAAVLAAAMVLSLGMSAMAYAATGEIHVNGTGIVMADPDTAKISLSVETMGKSSEAAQKENNLILQKVTKAMQDMGVTKENIVTTYTSVYPQYNYDDNGKRTVLGYRSYTDLQVTTKDIDNAGKYIDAALKAGATGTNGVDFSVADQSMYYGQALQAAVKNAGRSAQSIADAYGRQLGNVLSVTENSRNAYYVETASMNKMMATEDSAAAAGGGTTISYGKIQITANIAVTYGF